MSYYHYDQEREGYISRRWGRMVNLNSLERMKLLNKKAEELDRLLAEIDSELNRSTEACGKDWKATLLLAKATALSQL